MRKLEGRGVVGEKKLAWMLYFASRYQSADSSSIAEGIAAVRDFSMVDPWCGIFVVIFVVMCGAELSAPLAAFGTPVGHTRRCKKWGMNVDRFRMIVFVMVFYWVRFRKFSLDLLIIVGLKEIFLSYECHLYLVYILIVHS